MIKTTWTDFKNIVDNKGLSIQYIDFSTSSYELFAFDSQLKYNCIVPKTTPKNSDQIDFEDNYKPNGNKPLKQTVISEPADLSVTNYNASDIAEVAPGQEITIDYQLNQVGSELYQILYGGALHAQNYDFSDYLKFQIIDIDNVLGYGVNTLLKEYVQKAYLNNNGTFEDYDDAGAKLPIGVYLRCIYKSEKVSGSNTKIKINYLLGIA